MYCKNIYFSEYKKDYLVQTENVLIVNSVESLNKVNDVESKLYGKFIWKKQ